MEGWISLHRKVQNWEWYDDANTFRLFIHLLLNANHKPSKWRGIDINRGQFLTSRKRLATDLKISEQNIRTSLMRLKSTSELTMSTTSKYTLITITNYDQYQSANQQTNQQLTNNQPASNQQVTTNNNNNNKNNDNNNPPKSPPGEKYKEDFILFWEAYGKIGSKKQAEKKYIQKRKEGFSHEIILTGLNEYQSYCRKLGTERQYIKHASTWLHNNGWEDDYATPELASGGVQPKLSYRDRTIAAAQRGLERDASQLFGSSRRCSGEEGDGSDASDVL